MKWSLYELIKKSQMKDNKALMKIIEEFMPIIKKHSRKVRYDDITNELIIALINAVYNIPNVITEEKDIKNYIFKSIINEYNRILKNKTKIYNFEVGIELERLGKKDDDVETRILVYEVMDKLSNLQKEVIEYEFIEGYSESEIAEKLHVSRQAINRTKNRALKKMKLYIQCEYMVLI
ncbi:bacteriocin UviA [Clostridium tepidiprofundi DSM 19306]|uniref:Bacteriocin UviA n=1 Tax=Clostridium tepidiprofundi DSM 19306 TaxID=1121338 RepID=A0A151B056_9CLOT|nr:sigma-70 family RNA polymerase sigma factor [Clostridium tepidiprofundi]KYH33284.1 bacteriocin UviA [Clostridium tepidiprofundi DSM 19306]